MLIVYAHFMYRRRVDQFGFTCATKGFLLAPGSRGFDRLQVGEVMSSAHHSQGVTLQLPTQTTPWPIGVHIPSPRCSMVLEYLPTFTPKMAQMWVNIPYMEHMGPDLLFFF